MKKKTATTFPSLKTVFGPLWGQFNDPAVYGICIDSFNEVHIYAHKTEAQTNSKIFKTPKDLDAFISRLLRHAGKKIDDSTKSVFVKTDDYTQITIVFPPVAVKGPSVTIKKLPVKSITLDDLIQFKALDAEGKKLLLKLIDDAKGILVAGNFGSGKTTLLNTLVNAIPLPQRVVTIERYADLLINRPMVCRLQTANQTAQEMVELVSIAQQMYADYLVTSNFEGPETMSFLEVARNQCSTMGLITGENPLDALKRLETKAVLSSEGMTLEEARYAISQAFRHVVFQEKREDGQRIISSIGEIQYDAGELKLKVLYKR